MVNKSLSRIRCICPNGHEVITRKKTDIQCRKCSLSSKHSRFSIKVKTDPVIAEMATGMKENTVTA